MTVESGFDTLQKEVDVPKNVLEAARARRDVFVRCSLPPTTSIRFARPAR